MDIFFHWIFALLNKHYRNSTGIVHHCTMFCLPQPTSNNETFCSTANSSKLDSRDSFLERIGVGKCFCLWKNFHILLSRSLLSGMNEEQDIHNFCQQNTSVRKSLSH